VGNHSELRASSVGSLKLYSLILLVLAFAFASADCAWMFLFVCSLCARVHRKACFRLGQVFLGLRLQLHTRPQPPAVHCAVCSVQSDAARMRMANKKQTCLGALSWILDLDLDLDDRRCSVQCKGGLSEAQARRGT